jgi:hypothetical protein
MNHAIDVLERELANLKNYNDTKRVQKWREDVAEAITFLRDEVPERKKVLKREW